MNPLDKIELLEKIGLELQSKMKFDDIDIYFSAHGIETNDFQPSYNSKRIYAKEILRSESDEKIVKIANELRIPHEFSLNTVKEVGSWKTGDFRLFLSHLSSYKKNIAILQKALTKYGISAFVAHEDIEPSKEWQDELEAALHTMDALAAVLMEGFKESNWCDQEVGVAIGRDILIIPICKDLDPYGFIGKYQAIKVRKRTVNEIAELIFNTIVNSSKTKPIMLRSLIGAVSNARTIDEALAKFTILESVNNLSLDTLEILKQQVVENESLIESQGFIDRLNSLLTANNVESIKLEEETKPPEWDDDIPF